MNTTQAGALPERFTKKPVTIEAVQFTEALRDAIVLDGAPCPEGVKRGATTWHQKDRKIWRADFFIDTLEGRMNVEVGDWIIKGVKGEFYPCKPDIFEMTYDRTAPQSQPAAEFAWPEPEPATEADVLAGIAEVERLMGRPAAEACRQLVAPHVEQPAAAGVSDADVWELWLRVCAESDNLSTRVMIANFARAILALRPQSEPVGEAGTMPGTSGFTMACFHADKVPVGTKLYTEAFRPQAVPMTLAEVSEAHVKAPYTSNDSFYSIFSCGIRAAEAHHRITAQGAQGGEGKHSPRELEAMPHIDAWLASQPAAHQPAKEPHSGQKD